MSRLVVKFPTRSRPEKFKRVFSRYLTLLSGRHEVQFIVTMDADDAAMNNPGIEEWLRTRAANANIRWFFGNSRSKVEACNADLDGVDGDVLLLAADDMLPVRAGYDEVIFSEYAGAFPDFDGAIKFWDGWRAKEDPLMTLSLMGFPLYRRLGYIYHPAYRSVYADNEQTLVCMALGKLQRRDLCIIKHEWTGQPVDALHARNESADTYREDHETFQRRAAARFDLKGDADGGE